MLLKDFKFSFGEYVKIRDKQGRVYSGVFGDYDTSEDSDDGFEYVELRANDGTYYYYKLADYELA